MPYTVASSGSYRITAAANFSGVGLTISADDVYVDGQNYIQTANSTNIVVTINNHHNVTITNFNQTRVTKGGSDGLRIYGGSYDCYIYNSSFRNDTDCFRVYSSGHDILFDNIITENGTVHAFKTDGQSGAFDGTHYGVYNVNITNTVAYNSAFGPTSGESCDNIYWRNLTSINMTQYGFIMNINQWNNTIDGITISNPTTYSGSLEQVVNVTVSGMVVNGGPSLRLTNASQCTLMKNNLTTTGTGISLASNSNFTMVKQNILNTTTYGILSNAVENTTSLLNYFQNNTSPIFATGANISVLHNRYLGNSSTSTIPSAGRIVNDTALGLTMSMSGSGTISPTAGVHAVNGGNWSQTFTATPDAGYVLTAFNLNGVSVGDSSPLNHEIVTDSAMQIVFTSEGGPTEYSFQLTETKILTAIVQIQTAYFFRNLETIVKTASAISRFAYQFLESATIVKTTSATPSWSLLFKIQETIVKIATATITVEASIVNLIFRITDTINKTASITFTFEIGAVQYVFTIIDTIAKTATIIFTPPTTPTSTGSAFALAGLALIIGLCAFGAIFLLRRRQD